MTTLETTITAPFTVTEQGTIRISGTRVSLDSILHHYNLGATPEQIASRIWMQSPQRRGMGKCRSLSAIVSAK
jgi:hypothetical protein